VTDSKTDAHGDAEAEVRALRERLDALEREHAEEVARLHAALARAQERAYWLDRWHLDLNHAMTTPWGRAARAVVRWVRAPIRIARLVGRQFRYR
jgi:hypothetical protein